VFSEPQHVKGEEAHVTFGNFGGVALELVEVAGEQNPKLPILPHPILSHIEKMGEGMHHISFQVDDTEAEVERLKKQGIPIVANEVRQGAKGKAVFIDPNYTAGILIEFCEDREGE
jgi:methylmalonyl-CoA epimerase